MNVERLSFFYELFSLNYTMQYWQYTPGLELVQTTIEKNSYGYEIIHEAALHDVIGKAVEEKVRNPFLIEHPYGMEWLCEIEYAAFSPSVIHLYGAFFTTSDPQMFVRQKLQESGLFGSNRERMLEMMLTLPVIPSVILLSYGVMLHYTLTGEKISPFDIQIRSSHPTNEEMSFSTTIRTASSHAGVYEAEQMLLQMIRDGNLDYRKGLDRSMRLSSGVKADYKDPVRSAKNNNLTLLTLVTRAAIEGGLSPEISYSLNDYYADRCEKTRSVSQLFSLSSEMLDDFVSRVHETKIQKGISLAIQEACAYIHAHLNEDITIASLSSAAGYAEYYFSQKFKKETGQSVSEYLGKARIEQAKILLKNPGYSLTDIQEMIGMSSRSRFYALFKEYVGVSPTAYRNHNVL